MRIVLEMPFVCFHMSVFMCVVRQISRQNSVFSTGFFRIYAIQSVADIANYLVTVVFVRFLRVGLLPSSVVRYPFGNMELFMIAFLVDFQCVTHTAIALNRYTTIVSSKWVKMWAGWRFKFVFVGMLVLPIPGALTRFLDNVIVASTTADGISAVVFTTSWVLVVGNIVSVAYSGGTSVFCLFLELRTLHVFRSLSQDARRSRRHDFQLLVYAMLQFVAQFAHACYCVTMVIAARSDDRDLTARAQYVHSYVIDAMCLSGSICLFSASKAVRKSYKEMYLLGILDESFTSSFVKMVRLKQCRIDAVPKMEA